MNSFRFTPTLKFCCTIINKRSFQRGSLFVTNCRFTCENTHELTDVTTIYPDRDVSTGQYDYAENDYNEDDVINSGDDPIEVDLTDSVTNLINTMLRINNNK